MKEKITPNFWFEGNAQEAVEFYLSTYPDSKIISMSYYPKSVEEGLAEFQREFAGDVLAIDFQLGQHDFR